MNKQASTHTIHGLSTGAEVNAALNKVYSTEALIQDIHSTREDGPKKGWALLRKALAEGVEMDTEHAGMFLDFCKAQETAETSWYCQVALGPNYEDFRVLDSAGHFVADYSKASPITAERRRELEENSPTFCGMPITFIGQRWWDRFYKVGDFAYLRDIDNDECGDHDYCECSDNTVCEDCLLD